MFPRVIALRVAEKYLAGLIGVTTQRFIVGSVRRQKPFVKDVEILFIPRTERRPSRADMFTVEDFDLAGHWITEQVRLGLLEKRRKADGTVAWGNRIKLAREVESGVPLDFFATTGACWFNQLGCRTGPASLNIEISKRAQARHCMWNPTGPGFTDMETGTVHRMESEEAVFKFVGLPYLKPWERTNWEAEINERK